MSKEKSGIKPFISLILSTKIPKTTLILGLVGTIISTLISLAIPALTGQIVDGFSLELLSTGIIVAIVAAFLLQTVMDGVSVYLLGTVGQKIVARLREILWSKII